ncbi:PorP/SprF family type IX secretion system membrane protein [Fluviicola sp.]|uniref:PorP/SprF family type IX secretion system membrane protein n=1 Tax=Fluviicola sp. TaxID=1917219 RepID=UPI003D28A7A6
MKKLVAIVMCFVWVNSFAQQDPHFTQFFDNTLFINPAYAGSKDVLNITTLHREQWVGFDGRPISTTVSVHSPLSYKSIGVGITYVNDNVGPVKQNLFYGDVSYSLRFKNKSKLAFGIKGGLNLINIGSNSLNTTTAADPNLINNIRNHVNPNFGFGVYYHSPHWFIGASTPKLLEQSYDGSKTNMEKRHYFGHVGGVITLNPHWKLRPIAQVKFTPGAPFSLDASIAGIYNERFYIGALYRLDAAIGAFVQFQASKQFKLGFATDFGTQAIRNYNYGTFEIMLSYDFVFKNSGVRSPRYF